MARPIFVVIFSHCIIVENLLQWSGRSAISVIKAVQRNFASQYRATEPRSKRADLDFAARLVVVDRRISDRICVALKRRTNAQRSVFLLERAFCAHKRAD